MLLPIGTIQMNFVILAQFILKTCATKCLKMTKMMIKAIILSNLILLRLFWILVCCQRSYKKKLILVSLFLNKLNTLISRTNCFQELLQNKLLKDKKVRVVKLRKVAVKAILRVHGTRKTKKIDLKNIT